MAYTFRRAYKAILATSSTTAFAFLSNGYSQLMPISAFGYFAFVIVPVNYVLIVFYFPCYLIIYEDHVKELERKYFFMLCFWKQNKVKNKQNAKNVMFGIDDIEMGEDFTTNEPQKRKSRQKVKSPGTQLYLKKMKSEKVVFSSESMKKRKQEPLDQAQLR